MGDIVYQNKDIASKVTGEALVGLLPTNLPAIESKENFVKYVNYIARVIKRYANLHQLEELKQVKIVVIYTADVEHAESVYDLGGMVLYVESAFLVHQDTDRIYRELSDKICRHESLSEEELLQLMEDTRTDDLLKAACDESFREKLYREYGMKK